MESYGQLRLRYYVIKTSGIFAKNSRILEIYDEGIMFSPPTVPKGPKGKDAEFFYFKDTFELTLSDRNDKDIITKAGKQSFSIICSERVNLMTDLLYFKDIWDIRNNCASATLTKHYEGFKHLDIADEKSKVSITMSLLRSVMYFCYKLEEYKGDKQSMKKKQREYMVRYADVEYIIMNPNGFIIDKKTKYEKYEFNSDILEVIAAQIKILPKSFLGIALNLRNDYGYIEKKVISGDKFYITTNITRANGVVKEVKVHVDKNMIVQENTMDNKIMKSLEIGSIGFIKIKRKQNKERVLKIYSQRDLVFKYCLQSNKVYYLLSNILFSALSKEETEPVPFILRESAQEYIKINGMTTEADPTYETTLTKAISEACSTGDIMNEQLEALILEASFNASFKAQGYDPKFVASLFNILAEYATNLRNLEQDETAQKEYNDCFRSVEKDKPRVSTPKENTKGRLLLDLYRKLPPLLKVLRTLLCMRAIIPEVSVFQKQAETLFKLTGSYDSIVSFMSSLVLRALLRLNKSTEKRLETAGKKSLIKECDIIGKINEQLATFMEKSPEEFFDKFFANQSVINECPYLQIFGLLSIFEVILMEKKEGTHSEDLVYIMESILNNDKLLDMVEQVSMYNSKPIIYQASLISAQALLLAYNSEMKKSLASYQIKLLDSTMLFIWHVQLLLSSSSIRQQRLSASVATLLTVGNNESYNLLKRMLPRALLKKVDASKACDEWTPDNWKEFFILTQNNYCSVTEQWNDDCRKELIEKLKATALEFLRIKYAKKAEVNERPKWNHEEFEISYSCLESKCLVGGYYLSELVAYDESSVPYLKQPVVDPQVFMNKLITRFLSSTEADKQILIITTILLVYRDYSETLRELETLPYFILLLEKNELKHLHLLILKLIHATIKLGAAKPPNKTDIFKLNYKQIMRSNGLEVLMNMLAKAYRLMSDTKPDQDYAAICCQTMRILNCMLKSKEKQQVYPEAEVTAFCKKKACLSTIVQLLLIDNIEIRKIAIKMIERRFIKDSQILDAGVVDFLMYCLNESTGSDALYLLQEIQYHYNNYNSKLDIASCPAVDQELINAYPKIKSCVILRYFPICLVKYFIEDTNVKNFLAIYLNDEIVRPSIIWNKDMRMLFQAKLNEHFSGLKSKLIEFVSKTNPTVKAIPIYEQPFNSVIHYPQYDTEIRCGEYFLRAWNKVNGKTESANTTEFIANLNNCLNNLTSCPDKVNFSDLVVVLDSFQIIYTNPSNPNTFNGFPMLFNVIKHFTKSELTYENKTNLKNLFKNIFKTINIGANNSIYEEKGGNNAIISILNYWLNSLNVAQYKTVKAIDLKGINWGLMILHNMSERNNGVLNGTDIKELNELIKRLFDINYYVNYCMFIHGIQKSEGVQQKIKNLSIFGIALKTPTCAKNKSVKYSEITIDEIISQGLNMYIMSGLLQISELSLLLLSNMSKNYSLQEQFVLTGWSFMGIYYIQLVDSINYHYLKTIFPISYLQTLSLMILRHTCGFALKMKSTSPILNSFYTNILKLMGQYLVNQLVLDIDVIAGVIKEPPPSIVSGTLQQIMEKLDKDIEHPNLIWNSITRGELNAILMKQLKLNTETSEPTIEKAMSCFESFDYSINKDEVILGGVYLKVLNKNPYVKLENPASFLTEAIQELYKTEVQELETNASLLQRTNMIMDSLNNVVVYQKGIELAGLSPTTIKVLCKFLKPLSLTIPKHMEAIYGNVFSMFIEATKDPTHAQMLLSQEDFEVIALYHLCKLKNDFMAKRILSCMEGLVRYEACEESLINTGYAILIFSICFDNTADKWYRFKAMRFIEAMASRNKMEENAKILSNFVPQQFLDILQNIKKVEEMIELIDSDSYDSSIVWNAKLREQIRTGLLNEVNKIEQELSKPSRKRWIDMDKDLYIQDYVNQGELVVGEVVLSTFIKLPFCKLKRQINKLMESLHEQIIIHLTMVSQYQSDPSAIKSSKEEEKNGMKVHADNIQNGILSMTTALILAYEQVFKNNFNPNRLAQEPISRKSVMPSQPTYNVPTASIRNMITMGLRSGYIPEFSVTLLQLLYLIFEQKKMLEKDELQVVTVSVVQCLFDINHSDPKLEKFHEIVAFCILSKIVEKTGLTKGKDDVLDIIISKEHLSKFKSMYGAKPYLQKYLEYFVFQVGQNPVYYKMLQELKFELSPECKLEKLMKQKFENIDKLWRRSPAKMEDQKIYTQSTFFEDTDPNALGVGMFPLISKKVFNNEKFKESSDVFVSIYGSEVKELKVRASAPVGYKKL